MGVDADAADAAELEEGPQQHVVARVQVEAPRDDVPRLVEIVVACLTAATSAISASREIVSGSMLTTTRLGML